MILTLNAEEHLKITCPSEASPERGAAQFHDISTAPLQALDRKLLI